jgi:hypothetical protein
MRLRVERDLPVLLFLLVSASTIASLPQVQSTWDGVREVYGEQDFGLRLLRETMLVIIILYAGAERRFWNTVLSYQVFPWLILLACYVSFEVAYALHLGLPIIVPLTGLRVFEYLPLALLGLMVGRAGMADHVLLKFATYLRFYVIVQGVLALCQALWAPPLHGVSILGGGRPFGTFPSPNQFGTAMATCALIFALCRAPQLRKWIYVSALFAVLSGSRTAMFGAVVVVFFELYLSFRSYDRWILTLPAPVLFLGVLFLASNPLLSGREVDLEKEGRISLWQETLALNVVEPSDLLFGWGLGLGSNTINILFGVRHFPGQFDSDSLYLFILNGYGLLGLIAYLGSLLATLILSRHPKRGLVITFIFMAGLPFNVWEYFPQNAMLMFLWGLVLSMAKYFGVRNQSFDRIRAKNDKQVAYQ